MKIRDKLASGNGRKPIKTATTSERLQKIICEKNMKQADLARATGISRGAISNYVQGRYEPKSDIVQKLANALNCSEMWLWGYDVPMEKSARPFEDSENPYVLEMSDTADTLDVEHQIYLRDYVNEFAKDPDKMKKSLDERPLTEGEKTLLDLFNRVPEEQQQLVLQMIRVALGSRE